MVRTITAAAALTIAGSAIAVPQGAYWVEVDNSAGNTPDLVGGDTTGQRTFDLFVTLEAGDVLFAADFGVAGPNTGLTTTQTIWNHPTGSDLQQVPPAFAANVEFDTFLAMGDLDGTDGQISIQSFNDAGPLIGGVWNPNAPGGFTSAGPSSGNDFWMARFTLSSSGGFGAETGLLEILGGQMFLSGDGPNGEFGQSVPATGVINVPNAFPVPTPGAVALFGLAGAAATRRRR